MTDQFDVYSDSMTVTIANFGANLTFLLNEAHPAPSDVKPPTRLGTIRMSNEHLKVMAFILRRQMKKFQEDSGANPQVPVRVIAQLGIAPEDWDRFWS